MTSRVFAVQKNFKLDYGDAFNYGDVIFLTTNDYRFYEEKEVFKSIKDQLSTFNSKKDFVLPIGDPILIGVVFHLLFKKSDTLNVLKWDRRKNSYVKQTITMED